MLVPPGFGDGEEITTCCTLSPASVDVVAAALAVPVPDAEENSLNA